MNNTEILALSPATTDPTVSIIKLDMKNTSRITLVIISSVTPTLSLYIKPNTDPISVTTENRTLNRKNPMYITEAGIVKVCCTSKLAYTEYNIPPDKLRLATGNRRNELRTNEINHRAMRCEYTVVPTILV